MTAPFTIEALTPRHDRTRFVSGVETLDRYLATLALQDVKRRLSNCFVALDGDRRIAGYYTLAASSVPVSALPPDETKRLPRYPLLPAGLIGRLAVAESQHGRGLGAALILDAVLRSSRSDPAIFALLVEAKDERAAAFYRHLGFQPFVSRPHTLYLPIATALKALAGA